MAAVKKMKQAKKTVVYLERTVHDALKRRAAALKISMADIIRNAVDREMKRKEEK